MEDILAYCPDCWEMVTRDGRNILHLSVEFKKQEAFKFIMKKSWVGNLINQKDAEGNAPLHVYAATPNFHGYDLENHPQAEKNAMSKKNMTPLDVIMCSDVYSARQDALIEELKAKGAICQNSLQLQKKVDLENEVVPIDIRKVADTHMIVASLITTVAFAAGFTIPGGHGGNDGPKEGLAVLSRKAALEHSL
ncbi:Hypothetical predicted protein [Olea europaea subsp. europaea]|uniref:PGG domain-containing protein n=1 Tax=Olea europaea subsp. europaea TaxID=158383 RepID=A0A8S0VAU4_OLEEU|nr:Hypothetical predicted protein [Olea europaea subsp. europaea]